MTNTTVASNKPKIKLIGTDGNAFSLLGKCLTVAKKNKWTKQQINIFNNEAMSGDYDHLLSTIMKYFEVY